MFLDNVTTVIQGRARFPVNVRYLRDFRSDISSIERVLGSSLERRTIDGFAYDTPAPGRDEEFARPPREHHGRKAHPANR